MKYELHEQILLYLYELRHTDETYDLLIKFKDIPKGLIYNKAEELTKRDFIEIEYPFLGIGSVDLNTGQIDFPHAESEYLKSKIRNEGIEFVQANILKKTDWLDIIYKFFAIVGVLGTIFFSIKSSQQTDKTSELERTIESLTKDRDSLVEQAILTKTTIQTKEMEIQKLLQKSDSLTKRLTKIKNTPSK